MSEYNLNTIRYNSVFRWIVLIDMFTQITLWLIGAYSSFKINELDQIIKFDFTSSIFDILLISAFKGLSLFILLSELETTCINKAISSASEEFKQEQISDNLTTSLVTNADDESLITTVKSETVSFYSRVKNVFQYLIITVCFISLTYSSVKFGFVLKLIIENKNNKINLPMDYFYFSILTTEMVFSLIQFVISLFCSNFMKKFEAKIKQEALDIDNKNKDLKKKVNLQRLLSLSYPERFILLIAFFNLIISSVSTVVVPYFFGSVVDSALNYPNLDEMNKYILLLFFIYFVGSIASGIRSWLFEMAGQRVVARLRQNVFEAIVKQDISFFDQNRTGELTSRISSDTQVLQNAVTVNLSMFARYIIQIAGSIIFMLSLDPSLTGLLLGVVPFVAILAVQYGRYLRKLRKQFQDELALSSVVAEEAISSARTVKSFAAETKISNEYEKNIKKSYLIGKKLAIAGGGFMAFVGFLTSGALSLVLWYGGKLVHDKKITTGVLSSFLIYFLQVAMAFAFLSSLFGDFMQALGASQRIFQLLDDKPLIPSNIGLKPKNKKEEDETFDGSIIFSEVNFSYPTRKETKALDNVSFEIERGKTIALVGPSGGGKSTVFSLIERFYDPDSGEIRLNPSNILINKVETNWLHSKIALVSQEPVLFGGTIKENIAFGCNNEVDMNEIIQVSKLANAFEFIEALEKRFDTVVGERGIRLSGGQKQRIAIARALLINPSLLLLDEATSALDSESEHLVQEAIDRAMKDRTVCVIAHRLSTVRNADQVIVIDKGSIVERGTHDELCQMNGIYKKLVLRQLLNKESINEA